MELKKIKLIDTEQIGDCQRSGGEGLKGWQNG